MKSLIGLGFVLVAGVAGESMAQVCVSGQVLNNPTPGTTETATFVFGNWNPGQGLSATIAGRTMTCTGNVNSGITTAGYFRSGTAASPCSITGSLAGWTTSGTGATVIFTSTTPNTNVTDITYSSTGNGANIGTPPVIVQGSPGSPGALAALLTGSKVCGRPAAGYPGGAGSPDRWQEQHRAGGQLWDYKLGPGHPIDQEKQVGSYGFTGTGAASAVTHTYGSTTYTWQVYLQTAPNTYSFCSGGIEQVRAFVTAGATGGCASFPSYP